MLTAKGASGVESATLVAPVESVDPVLAADVAESVPSVACASESVVLSLDDVVSPVAPTVVLAPPVARTVESGLSVDDVESGLSVDDVESGLSVDDVESGLSVDDVESELSADRRGAVGRGLGVGDPGPTGQ